ncbi:hypothetical protein HMPREF9123_2619 [Neisseria bacilliformis ATCC BAA-1200]|uniref:Uncharacterized protein n=1 Tax=Neisseria bacilliformis ATCC BAA-1200 TaxID=888742 RepID=F2BFW2_9NEIS|nr:hypothetical protein HMPREF9123_2619 [Neisseria bacilliformis ATCC BAA-1200]
MALAHVFALHLPFYDAKSAAKVECQQTLPSGRGRLKKHFSDGLCLYTGRPAISAAGGFSGS